MALYSHINIKPCLFIKVVEMKIGPVLISLMPSPFFQTYFLVEVEIDVEAEMC